MRHDEATERANPHFGTNELLVAQPGPELVIGLIGPVGSNLSLVTDVLKKELDRVSYNTYVIKLSALLSTIDKYSNLNKAGPEDERIEAHMRAGTDFREVTGHGDMLALLAVSAIRNKRKDQNKADTIGSQKPLYRTAYILDSLKHPEEVYTLRNVYGPAFIVVSAYCPRVDRLDNLSDRIRRSRRGQDGYNPDACRVEAERLIRKDESEKGHKLGQNVTLAFALADIFVDTRSKPSLKSSLQRFIELFFGYPYHTPSRDEFGMFHAYSVALRSADLARQVGAVIANSDGAILAAGCNEVPKYGGGIHWWPDSNDNRDFQKGVDSSDQWKRDILREVLQRLQDHAWLSTEKRSKQVSEHVDDLLSGSSKKVLDDAQIMDILEFGRSVHAEMVALSDAAMRGVGIKGETLYCTTFPCHMCARHIISCGIKRVVYIEPYPKSMAKELYGDFIAVDSNRQLDGYVNFEPFVGIAPRLYIDLFSHRGKRKDRDGHALDWTATKSNPKIKIFVLSYLAIEGKIVGQLIPSRMNAAGLTIC